jgi:pyruvate dehydrogenase (quinone)
MSRNLMAARDAVFTCVVGLPTAGLAEAVGIKDVRIKDPADVEAKLAEGFAHEGPVVVDAVVSHQELATPPTAMSKGFTLYMPKAALNGRADEVVELAKANLLR